MLQLSEVSKVLGGRRVLDHSSLFLGQQEIGVVSGASGAGKTTLLRLIAGLEPPESGEISWRAEPLSGPNTWVSPWQRPFAMVFQDLGLWPHLTVSEHLAFVLRSRRELTRADRRRMERRWLSELQIAELSHRYPAELSGGQQQRVAIARSLVRDPQLVLLDEAFAHLDKTTADVVWTVIEDWRRESGGTVLAVTHDTAWIERHATQWFALEEGHTRVRLLPNELRCTSRSSMASAGALCLPVRS